MGFNWKKLGYESIRDFIEHTNTSEGAQLDAVCRYIKVMGLDVALRKHDLAAFAKGYNGKDYQRNDYDNKMSTAYAKAKREGLVMNLLLALKYIREITHRSTDYSCYRPHWGVRSKPR